MPPVSGRIGNSTEATWPACGGSAMERLCHVLQIVPGKEDEYVRRHVEMWPKMVGALRASGVENFALFRRGTDVIAVCECHPDVGTCLARFAKHGVGVRWQASMQGLIADLADGTRELVRYEEVWRLSEHPVGVRNGDAL